jgi:hypothetical protein
MKDEDLKFEEIETSHTLGREGRYYDAQDQLLKVVPSVRKLAPHWSQLSGDKQSACKQENARGIGYVPATSSQTRSVYHARY